MLCKYAFLSKTLLILLSVLLSCVTLMADRPLASFVWNFGKPFCLVFWTLITVLSMPSHKSTGSHVNPVTFTRSIFHFQAKVYNSVDNFILSVMS